MQKVKSQHPAICWPIDVTQIFKDGMPGRAGPAQGMQQPVGICAADGGNEPDSVRVAPVDVPWREVPVPQQRVSSMIGLP